MLTHRRVVGSALAFLCFVACTSCRAREDVLVDAALARARQSDVAGIGGEFKTIDDRLRLSRKDAARTRMRLEFAKFVSANWAYIEEGVAKCDDRGERDEFDAMMAELGKTDAQLAARWVVLVQQTNEALAAKQKQRDDARLAQARGAVLVSSAIVLDLSYLQRALSPVTDAPFVELSQPSSDEIAAANGVLTLAFKRRTHTEKVARRITGSVRTRPINNVINALRDDATIEVLDGVAATVTLTRRGTQPQTWKVEASADTLSVGPIPLTAAELALWPEVCRQLRMTVAQK